MTWAGIDHAAVVIVLLLHLVWILWVIFGAFWTSHRRWLTSFHIASLIWGIMVEVGPWPCPLTVAENFFQRRVGAVSSSGDFMQHYISSIVYPDVSLVLLTVVAVAVCVANLGMYAWRTLRWIDHRPQSS
jgi:hypothetical protein